MILTWIWFGFNLFVLAVYARDKVAAKQGGRRTPESTLLWLAAAGGGAGALAAVYLLRHKSRKPRFAMGVPLLLALQVAAWLWHTGRLTL